MPLMLHLSDIFCILLISILHCMDVSYSLTSQDVHIENIRTSISSDRMMTSPAAPDATRSSKNSDDKTSSTTESTLTSVISNNLMSYPTRSSINSDVTMSFTVLVSTQASINPDKNPPAPDTTQLSITCEYMTSAASPDPTHLSTTHEDVTSPTSSDPTHLSTTHEDVTYPTSSDPTHLSTTHEDVTYPTSSDPTHLSTTHEDVTSSASPDPTHLSTTHEDVTSAASPDPTHLSTTHEDVTSHARLDPTHLSTTQEDVTSPASSGPTVPTPATVSSIDSLVVTGSTYLFLGDNLTLTCSLPDQLLANYTAKNISFNYSQPFVPHSTPTCVPMSRIQPINETAARMNICNVTFSNAGQYTCFSGDTYCQFGIESVEPSPFGFVDDVKIEYIPHNVTHFQCVVYDWDENMACTWQHPVEYKDWSNIDVTSLYSQTTLVPNKVCPRLSNTSCYWDSVFTVATYKVQVNVTNKVKNQTSSRTFTTIARENVKPAPVEDLTIVPVPRADMSGCLQLSWTHPRKNYSKHYRIKHKVVGDGSFSILADCLANTSFISCSYHAYTHHNFSVECLPAGNYSGYVSDPVYKDVWTPMTEPDLGPSATNGSYTSTRCVDGLRNVTLLWQAVEQSAQNGVITGYLVRLGQDNLTSVDDAGVFSATVELSCDSVSVDIFAFNQQGLSISPSVLLISTATVPIEIQNSFVVEILSRNGSAEIAQASWEKAEKASEEMRYIIFWCKGLLQETCEDEIQWQEVAVGHTQLDIPVDSSDAGKYIYGISVRNAQTGITSELFWTPCLFRRNPPRLPKIDGLNVKSLENSAYITWSGVTCYYQNQVRYTSYVVTWCQTSACNKSSQTNVSVSESRYTAAPLTAGVNYSFTVQPVSYGVSGDEVTPWVVAVPSAADQGSSLDPLGPALGGLAGGVFVLIIVVFAWRYCRRRGNKINKLAKKQILIFPTTGVQELGPLIEVFTSEAPPHVQQTCLASTNKGSSIHLSDKPGSTLGSRPSNGYSIFTENETLSKVCNNLQDQGCRQAEQDSTSTDPPYMSQANLLPPDKAPYAKPPLNGYSRFIENEPTSKVCHNLQDQDCRQPEQGSTSTDLAYMPQANLLPSNKASHKESVCSSGSTALYAVSTIAPTTSNNSVLHMNAVFEKHSEDEETHARQFSLLTTIGLRDDHKTGKISIDDRSELEDPIRTAQIPIAERSQFKEPHRTTQILSAERSEVGDNRPAGEVDEILGLGDYCRTAEPVSKKHATLPNTTPRAASKPETTSDTLEGRIPDLANINEGNEISYDESDADSSCFGQKITDFLSLCIPENGSDFRSSDQMRSHDFDSSISRHSTPCTLSYIQLGQLSGSDNHTCI